MSEHQAKIDADRQLILDAKERGTGATLGVFAKLSGPGWLQSAITLGGGSLAGSLYLGVIAGYQLLWLQPLMMILGVVMLSAIGYVALSTGERPFDTINRHINPVLGWGWAIATLMANLVWAMPQFSLGTAAIRQNLMPGLGEGTEIALGAGLVANSIDLSCAGALFLIAAIVIWFYDSGGWGIKLFEILLKIMVAVVVLSFFGVVIAMTVSGGLPWGEILSGFVPNFRLLNEPADKFASIIAETSAPAYWTEQILFSQRDRMVTAAATAVGINMTFLLPYSMLKRGWDRDFRGLAVFDLSTGLFIPFFLATSCVVIAAASQFHGQYDPGLIGEAEPTEITAKLEKAYQGNLAGVVQHLADEQGVGDDETQVASIQEDLSLADRKVAAMLVKRDAFLLANSLEDLTGKVVAQTVFGVGVLGMAISTIIILMLINGFTMCEMLGLRSEGVLHRLFSFLPGLTGAAGFLFLWSTGANFWLAVPTSVFGMVLLPIAYVTFFFLMNSNRVLGDHRPRGVKGFLLNLSMLIALVAATIGAGWSIWGRRQTLPPIEVRWVGIVLVIAFVGLALVVYIAKVNTRTPDKGDSP